MRLARALPFMLALLAASFAQPASIVINEVYYDSPGEDRGTFVELKGPAGSSLTGFGLATLSSSGKPVTTIPLSGALSSSGYAVVAQDSSVPNAVLVNDAVNLPNSGGGVRLLRGSSVLDAVAYGSARAGEGRSAPNAKPGESLARVPDGADTNNNAKDFKAVKPTPGLSNTAPNSMDLTNPTPPSPPSATNPPASSATSKLVLFDLSKGEASGNADWRIDGAYSSWADELRRLGFTVRSLEGRSITAEALKGAAALVIPEPQNPFSDAERGAILEFVRSGAGFLMIADHRDSDRDNDGWDSPEVFNGWDGRSPKNVPETSRKSLDASASFGLSFSFASSFNDPVITVKPLNSPAMLEGVTSAGIYVGTSVDVRSGTPLLGANGKTYLASSEVGQGRVLAYGDSSAFSDGTFSDGTRSRYNNWVNLSNARLAVNMIRWLTNTR